MSDPITRRASLAGLLGVVALGASGARAAAPAKLQALVDDATRAAANFVGDESLGWVRQNVGTCKGVVIVPHLVKAGLIFGGSGGSGTLLGRDPQSGAWSYPAFCTLGSGTFGLQIGVAVSEIILLIMTSRGMDAMLSTNFKLGGDISVAAGPVGAGAKAATADVIAFSRSKGLYGGLNVEGAVLASRGDWNRSYYGSDVTVSDIVIRNVAQNPQADELRRAVAALGR